MGDPGEYRKCIMGSELVSEMYDGIRASIGEGKIWVSTGKGRIRASTENGGSGRVPEKVKFG